MDPPATEPVKMSQSEAKAAVKDSLMKLGYGPNDVPASAVISVLAATKSGPGLYDIEAAKNELIETYGQEGAAEEGKGAAEGETVPVKRKGPATPSSKKAKVVPVYKSDSEQEEVDVGAGASEESDYEPGKSEELEGKKKKKSEREITSAGEFEGAGEEGEEGGQNENLCEALYDLAGAYFKHPELRGKGIALRKAVVSIRENVDVPITLDNVNEFKKGGSLKVPDVADGTVAKITEWLKTGAFKESAAEALD